MTVMAALAAASPGDVSVVFCAAEAEVEAVSCCRASGAAFLADASAPVGVVASLDSDVLPPANALRLSLWSLAIDAPVVGGIPDKGGYYAIATQGIGRAYWWEDGTI